jgi:3-oxoacyl-[acyl-carrier protein] reductase
MTTPRPAALITGASRGIGAATARELGRRGYHVIVNYRVSAEAAGQVASDVEAAGGTATPIAADVTDPAQVQALTEKVTAEFGGIDLLVCNANAAQPRRAGRERGQR